MTDEPSKPIALVEHHDLQLLIAVTFALGAGCGFLAYAICRATFG